MTDIKRRPIGTTGIELPPIVFGISCLGNLYKIIPHETKLNIVRQALEHVDAPVVFDGAGKYGAGLALETLGQCLRESRATAENVIISNKLGWYRIPLKGDEPTFEPGAWMGLEHDAEQRISAEGILDCQRQGEALLGEPYSARLLSVHDPDEYLAAADSPPTGNGAGPTSSGPTNRSPS